MGSTTNSIGCIVSSAAETTPSMNIGKPNAHCSLGGHEIFSQPGSAASAAATPQSQGSGHVPNQEDNALTVTQSGHHGVFAKGFSIFSSILSCTIKLCGGGYTPFVKQAEKDIDKVAEFVEAGARLVVKVADEIEAMAHVAELSAQEAEDLAVKVEAKTQLVKQTLDAIADVLEGDRKLSSVLTDYATLKKQQQQQQIAQKSQP